MGSTRDRETLFHGSNSLGSSGHEETFRLARACARRGPRRVVGKLGEEPLTIAVAIVESVDRWTPGEDCGRRFLAELAPIETDNFNHLKWMTDQASL